jgi:hypothetical protein
MEANRGIGHRQSRLAAGHRRRRGEAALTAEHDAASLQPIDPLDSQHGRSALRSGQRCALPGAALVRDDIVESGNSQLLRARLLL